MQQYKKYTPQIKHDLKIIDHPIDYQGHRFISLLHLNDNTTSKIILDNTTSKLVNCYNLDLCGQEDINIQYIIPIILNWYTYNKQQYPISIAFSKLGLTHTLSKIYKTYYIEQIKFIQGITQHYELNLIKQTKKRTLKQIAKQY